MTKSQRMWRRAAKLLSDPGFFESERARVLEENPSLNSYGLGQARRRRKIPGHNGRDEWETELIPADLGAAREELQAGGKHEPGIRNTLEYLAKARVPLSYRLRGCGWARRFNGPAPARRSSYGLKHDVESHLRGLDAKNPRGNEPDAEADRYTSNGAFVCAALMADLQMWTFRDSVNPSFRLGRPWAVAGLQPRDYESEEDEQMANFWRWVARHDVSNSHEERFIGDTVRLLYDGADLQRLRSEMNRGGSSAREVFDRLRREFGAEFGVALPGDSPTIELGFMDGEMLLPEDFDQMFGDQIEQMFGASR